MKKWRKLIPSISLKVHTYETKIPNSDENSKWTVSNLKEKSEPQTQRKNG